MTDPILAAIDNAVRDYTMSADAMRWAPEPLPNSPAQAPAPARPRVQSVEVTVRMTDGTLKTMTLTEPEEVTWTVENNQEEDPWDIYSFRPVGSRRVEKVTFEIEWPVEVAETLRLPEAPPASGSHDTP